MNIHGFALPPLLESDLKSGGRKLSERELARLNDRLVYLDSPRPRFWRLEHILSEHSLWSSPAVAYYLGTEGTEFIPGQIDPNHVLIVGEADEDSPIALDYRTVEPRVVYLGSASPGSVWIELESSYQALIEKLERD